MKKLLERFLKKESELSYILPEYQPAPASLNKASANQNEYELDSVASDAEIDEMQIDRIYRCQ